MGLARRDALRMLTMPLRWLPDLKGRVLAAQLPVRVGPIRLDTPRVVARCRQLGLRLDYWVVNDAETAQGLARLGANGVMTDDPARVATGFL
jgi:glycerophosphoryl diester phosphodiesterase